MRKFETTLTQRGQVTVPVEVRRLLGLKPRDKVAFTIDDGEVRVEPAAFTLETAFGSVKPLNRPDPRDFDQQIREAKDERAERTIRELLRG